VPYVPLQIADYANIRPALIDRFGGSTAIGREAAPGPPYGISRDVWSALAIGVTYIGNVCCRRQ
jgi:hypothetical protein